MRSFAELLALFEHYFNRQHFPEHTPTLYDPARYMLTIGGKRVRPVAVLMGNELFGELSDQACIAATAVELFHNFTLIHDDIMDKAPLRRGMETVHTRWGEPTALLAGDVMLVRSYSYLNSLSSALVPPVIALFSQTAAEVCEGQQLDMDFEQRETVTLQEYEHMIALKTAVLLGASLQIGAIIGGASEHNQQLLYGFGKNLGIAFQVQDDYLDAFGNPENFGKQVGGDILVNKKTFLTIQALERAGSSAKKELLQLMKTNPADKVEKVLQIYRDCRIDEHARSLKDKYFRQALAQLDAIAVLSKRKGPLFDLAEFLINRMH